MAWARPTTWFWCSVRPGGHKLRPCGGASGRWNGRPFKKPRIPFTGVNGWPDGPITGVVCQFNNSICFFFSLDELWTIVSRAWSLCTNCLSEREQARTPGRCISSRPTLRSPRCSSSSASHPRIKPSGSMPFVRPSRPVQQKPMTRRRKVRSPLFSLRSSPGSCCYPGTACSDNLINTSNHIRRDRRGKSRY